MPEAEALQLLTGRPDPEALPAGELAEAKALAADLGYLPLALAQAAAYIHEMGREPSPATASCCGRAVRPC